MYTYNMSKHVIKLSVAHTFSFSRSLQSLELELAQVSFGVWLVSKCQYKMDFNETEPPPPCDISLSMKPSLDALAVW